MIAYEGIFESQFDLAMHVLRAGMRGAWRGARSVLPVDSSTLPRHCCLRWCSAHLREERTPKYLQMVEVLNLVVFTVLIGSQLMVFSCGR